MGYPVSICLAIFDAKQSGSLGTFSRLSLGKHNPESAFPIHLIVIRLKNFSWPAGNGGDIIQTGV
jgi:hypothetical protein